MPSDTLTIHGLVVQCRLGVFEWEQAKPQTVWIDLELAIDAAKAAAQDEVKDAVDYGALVTAIRQLIEQKPYHLMETMAEEVAALMLRQFNTSTVHVRVKKQALPGIDFAAVNITRTFH